jgi:hypothetical protein
VADPPNRSDTRRVFLFQSVRSEVLSASESRFGQIPRERSTSGGRLAARCRYRSRQLLFRHGVVRIAVARERPAVLTAAKRLVLKQSNVCCRELLGVARDDGSCPGARDVVMNRHLIGDDHGEPCRHPLGGRDPEVLGIRRNDVQDLRNRQDVTTRKGRW